MTPIINCLLATLVSLESPASGPANRPDAGCERAVVRLGGTCYRAGNKPENPVSAIDLSGTDANDDD
ncbi:MAG: hypothetical protein LW700_07955, partial [Gemmataceae bacterium]|nr:hypothetical protein [Gemmataceae bacterium]